MDRYVLFPNFQSCVCSHVSFISGSSLSKNHNLSLLSVVSLTFDLLRQIQGFFAQQSQELPNFIEFVSCFLVESLAKSQGHSHTLLLSKFVSDSKKQTEQEGKIEGNHCFDGPVENNMPQTYFCLMGD